MSVVSEQPPPAHRFLACNHLVDGVYRQLESKDLLACVKASRTFNDAKYYLYDGFTETDLRRMEFFHERPRFENEHRSCDPKMMFTMVYPLMRQLSYNTFEPRLEAEGDGSWAISVELRIPDKYGRLGQRPNFEMWSTTRQVFPRSIYLEFDAASDLEIISKTFEEIDHEVTDGARRFSVSAPPSVWDHVMVQNWRRLNVNRCPFLTHLRLGGHVSLEDYKRIARTCYPLTHLDTGSVDARNSKDNPDLMSISQALTTLTLLRQLSLWTTGCKELKSQVWADGIMDAIRPQLHRNLLLSRLRHLKLVTYEPIAHNDNVEIFLFSATILAVAPVTCSIEICCNSGSIDSSQSAAFTRAVKDSRQRIHSIASSPFDSAGWHQEPRSTTVESAPKVPPKDQAVICEEDALQVERSDVPGTSDSSTCVASDTFQRSRFGTKLREWISKVKRGKGNVNSSDT